MLESSDYVQNFKHLSPVFWPIIEEMMFQIYIFSVAIRWSIVNT